MANPERGNYDCTAVAGFLDEAIALRVSLKEKLVTGLKDKDFRQAKKIVEQLKPILKDLKRKGIPNYIDGTARPRDWTKSGTRWVYKKSSIDTMGEIIWEKEKQESAFIRLPITRADATMNGVDIFEHIQKNNVPVLNAAAWKYLRDNPSQIPESWKTPINGKTPYVFFWGTLYGTVAPDIGSGIRCIHYNPDKKTDNESEKWDFTGVKAIEDEDWGRHDVIATLALESQIVP